MTIVKHLSLISFAVLFATSCSPGLADDQKIQRFRSANDMQAWRSCVHATRGCMCNPRPLLEACDGNAQCVPYPLDPPAKLLTHADDPTCPVLGKRR
jgi:hypothetical protein